MANSASVAGDAAATPREGARPPGGTETSALEARADGDAEDEGEGDTSDPADVDAREADRPGAEQRAHQRVRAVRLVQYKRFDPDYAAEQLVTELGLGKTLNLSEGGLTFVCTAPLPPSWGLHLDLMVDSDQILQVQGRIVHVEEVSEGRYRVGVRFKDLSEEASRRLRALVTDRAARQASLL